MNRKSERDKRTSRIVIRTTKNEHDAISKLAMSNHQSISNYCLNAINRRHGNTKVIDINKDEREHALKDISSMETQLQEYHADYARYLANLNHIMKLYNSYKIPYINGKSLREAELVAEHNRKQLAAIKENLHQFEAVLWR